MRFQLRIDPEKEERVLVSAHRRSELVDQIEALVSGAAAADQLAAYSEEDMRMLVFAEIELIYTEDGKTLALDQDGTPWRLRQRLYEVEEMLPGYFVRLSKSAIANQRSIIRFNAGFSGAVDAELRCGRKESVSRRCFAEIKRRLSVK
jgi:DNA-binding LytR/AlgR family response regulator